MNGGDGTGHEGDRFHEAGWECGFHGRAISLDELIQFGPAYGSTRRVRLDSI